MYLKKLILLLFLTVFFTQSHGENKKISGTENAYNFYVGTWDTIDKEGDDKSRLYGMEHSNENLYRDTILGKFSPISGGLVTGKGSVYLYTGVQAVYKIGPLNIVPSFAPGYYERGEGKELGSALEFKSEIKVAFDIFKNSNDFFKNSKIGYSYSHISNNDWGDINPGVNNQQISFSKNF